MERQLALLAWLHQLLGYQTTGELLKDNKPINEGFREDGRSHICAHLESRSAQMQGLTVQDLQRYDDNIRKHLAAMNDGRAEPITLRYFQYLAALYTEIYLDWRFNPDRGLLPSLNAFVRQHNAGCAPDQRWDQFTSEDLSKLAFWTATGGGKTLLLHLHYRQFMHYNRTPLDNILLITPNEGLSQQHLEEPQASNIPATRFDVNEAGSLFGQPRTVRVTEITKLVEGGTLKKCVNSQAVYPLSETTRAQGPREEIHRLWEREALGAGRSQGRSGTSWRTGFEVRSRS